MASTLAAEATTHAQAYGDRRAMRSLSVLQAQLAFDEGKHAEVTRIVKKIVGAGNAELEQTVEIGLLLSDTYQASGQQVIAEEILKDARNAILASPETKAKVVDTRNLTGTPPKSSRLVLADSTVQHARVLVEVSRIDATKALGKSWIESLDATFSSYIAYAERLREACFHKSEVTYCLEFARAMTSMLDSKRLDLTRDILLSVRQGGILSFQILLGYGQRLFDVVSSCKVSCRALLERAVPIEGLDYGVVTPAQVLCAQLDVCEARVVDLNRLVRAAAADDVSLNASNMEEGRRFFRSRSLGASEVNKRYAGLDVDTLDLTSGAMRSRIEALAADCAKAEDVTQALHPAKKGWEGDVDDRIEMQRREKADARELGEAEGTLPIITNAVTLLRTLAERPDDASTGEEKGGVGATSLVAPVEPGATELKVASTDGFKKGDQIMDMGTVEKVVKPDPSVKGGPTDHVLFLRKPLQKAFAKGSIIAKPYEFPRCRAEARVELGRILLELGAQKWTLGQFHLRPPGAAELWEEKPPKATAAEDDSAAAEKLDEEATAEATAVEARSAVQLFHSERGAEELEEAFFLALEAQQLEPACRALRLLAIEAYGMRCPADCFRTLVTLQSVEVCLRAEQSFDHLLPASHHEAVQLRNMRRLEKQWSVPHTLHAYQTALRRLSRESPSFQRLRICDLPSTNELLLNYVPSNTLVVTLQMHGHRLYVAAACSSPEGDVTQRMEQIRPLVFRIDVWESDLHTCTRKLSELQKMMEKYIIANSQPSAAIESEYESILAEVEAHLVAPIAKRFQEFFWQEGTVDPKTNETIEHPSNPKQMIILPDSELWPLPLERFDSLLQLFPIVGAVAPGGGPQALNYSAITRDLSLHLAAQRVAKNVDLVAPLKSQLAGIKPDTTGLVTDAFGEDFLLSSEPPASELLSSVHKRLVDAKVIGGGDTICLSGKSDVVSAESVKTALADSSALYGLGFARFFNLVPIKSFASQKLSHVALLALFQRAINFDAFRRQTKAESSMTPRQAALESVYGLCLVSAFRGVSTTLITTSAIPTPVASRALEIFAREVSGGKTVAKALEMVLNCQIPSPDLRYSRTQEGGLLPGGVQLDSAPPVVADPKAKAPSPEPGTREVWLSPYMRSSFVLVGSPWTAAGEADAKGKKK
jgi:hypothetical protein